MDIGWAVNAAKNGARVHRSHWNGQGMSIGYVGTKLIEGPGGVTEFREALYLKTADGTHVPWTASQTDLLAMDWHLAPERKP